MGMGVKRPGYHLGAHLSRAGTDASLGGLGDAALDAQHLHRRVAAVSGARSDEGPRSGSHLLQFGARAGEDADDARAGEQLVGEGDDLGGGGVEGLGHRPQGVAAAEGRGQQGERNRPGSSTPRRGRSRRQRHPVLPGQDGEDRLAIDPASRFRWLSTTPRTSSTPAGLKPPMSSGPGPAASSASQPARKVSVDPATSGLALRVESAATSAARAESSPRSASAFSTSTRRLENARKDLPGDPRHFAQPAAPHLPGEAQRGELGA